MATDKKTDRRVRRTKTLLTNALIQLLKEKNIKDITVTELCNAADVNRGTFYLHYRDIYDMMEQLENDLLDQYESLLTHHARKDLKTMQDDLPLLVLDLFLFTDKNAELFRIFLGANGDMSFVNKLKAFCRNLYLDAYISKLSNTNTDQIMHAYNFIAAGCTGLIESWLFSGGHETPEEIAALTSTLITTGIASFLN